MALQVGELFALISADDGQFRSALSSAESAFKKVGKGISKAGKSMTKNVTAPIVGIGLAVVKISADFEKGMSKVQAVSGASGKDLDKLRQKAKDMGATTKFSATESAEAMNFMAMAGWKTNQIMDGLDGVMNLAAASGEDLATVSDIVTDSMTAFGMEAKKSGEFADLLAAAASNSNTNVAMLGESFKYAAPVAGALGFSARDTSLALGLMANAGIKASQSGTSMRSIMTNLVKPTKSSSVAIKKLGLEILDSKGEMKSFDTIMKDLRKGFSGMTKDQKAATAANLAGKNGMSGLLAVVNSSEADFNKLGKALDTSKGKAKEMADIMGDNFAGQLTRLKSALEGVAIQLGEVLAPVLKKLVSNYIQPAVDAFAKLSKEQKTTIVVVAAIVAAIGPLLIIIGAMGTGVGTAIAGFSALAAIFSPVGLAIIAVVAIIGILIAAVIDLWNNNKEFRDDVKGLWLDIQKFIGKVVDKVTEFWEEWGPTIKLIFKNIWAGLKRIIGDSLKDWRSVFKIGSALLEGDFETVFEEIKNIIVRKMGLAQDAIRAAIFLTQDLYNLQNKMAKKTDDLKLAKDIATSGTQGLARVKGKKQDLKGSSSIQFDMGKVTSQSNISGTRATGYQQHYASGTNFAPGGLSLLGESGPELVDLPRGSKVHTNRETNRMLGGGGGMDINLSGTIKVDTGKGMENLSSKAVEKIVAQAVINNVNRFKR